MYYIMHYIIHKVVACLCITHICTYLVLHLTAVFTVSLELQGHCSDQLTLICRHSDTGSPPVWIHNRTLESGETLGTAFSGAVYTVIARTEHTATITGIDNVRALDGHVIQCAYDDLGTLIKSNAVKYSFIPPGQCMCCTECPSWYIHMSMHTNCWCESSNIHLSWSWPGPSLVDIVVVAAREDYVCDVHTTIPFAL